MAPTSFATVMLTIAASVLTQQLARHKDLRTTQRCFHVRGSRLLKAAVRLNRKTELGWPRRSAFMAASMDMRANQSSTGTGPSAKTGGNLANRHVDPSVR
jgi:hypothetical protein